MKDKKGQINNLIRAIILAFFVFLISEGFNEAFKQLITEDTNLIIKVAIFLTAFPWDFVIILGMLIWYIYDLFNK
jgi:uncharacterized transporter YbjL